MKKDGKNVPDAIGQKDNRTTGNPVVLLSLGEKNNLYGVISIRKGVVKMSSFAKVNSTLIEICNHCDYVNTEKCSSWDCNIGFSKKLVKLAIDESAKVFKDGLEIIPKKDFKAYDKDLIANGIGEICKLCKQCNENHSEECIISLSRRSLENTTLVENVVYPGSVLMYLMKVSNQDSDFAKLIKSAYERN